MRHLGSLKGHEFLDQNRLLDFVVVPFSLLTSLLTEQDQRVLLEPTDPTLILTRREYAPLATAWYLLLVPNESGDIEDFLAVQIHLFVLLWSQQALPVHELL